MSGDWKEQSALVVGFGSIGRRHTRVLRELGVKDIRLVEPLEERRRAAADEMAVTEAYNTLEEGLAGRPDTVFLCSPTADHVPQAMAALEAGCHVFTEKPLSVSTEGLDDLEDLARRTGRKVMVGQCYRFHAGCRRLKDWLDEGRLGRLLFVRSMFGEYIPDAMPDYRTRYVSKYSGAYELMHAVDLAVWYAGTDPVQVLGLDRKVGEAEMESPDLVEMIVEFDGSRAASVHMDFFQRARHIEVELYGTEGTARLEFGRWDRCAASLYEASAGEWQTEEMATDRDDMFRAEDSEFLKACAGEGDVSVPVSEGRKAVEVMLAARESSRTGQAVHLQR